MVGGNDREPQFCECLCAALAKKNKARAMPGSDFSMEAWQETGSSGGEGEGVRGCTLCPHREKETEQPSSSLTTHPA